jgi:two-component system phosphate regulon response regulator PhoB
VSSILVVDHDAVVATVLEVTLSSKGHEVHVVTDAAGGRRALDADGYDLVIVDIFLPGGSGLDVVRHLREHLGRATPVIVLSGLRQAALARRAAEAGATSQLAKPFSPRALLVEVARLTEVASVGG